MTYLNRKVPYSSFAKFVHIRNNALCHVPTWLLVCIFKCDFVPYCVRV